MNVELNFEEDLRIDPNALDVELLDHANRYMRYAQAAAFAREKLDRAKEKLDVARAELAANIRENPGNFHLPKITESSVTEKLAECLDETECRYDKNSLVLGYKSANEALITARTDADLAASAVRAFDHRKSALENLVRLHAASYFAGPKEPRDLGHESTMAYQARERQREEASKKTAEHMRRRRRAE